MSHINTKCIQEGWKPKDGEPRVLPIYQSTTFLYETTESLANLFDLKAEGFFYSRLANPTVDAVEKKLAALEGGVGAMLTASGQSATLISVLNIASAGDHILCASAIYGGTYNLFNKTMRQMGIEFDFIDPFISPEELNGKFKQNTKAVFTETVSNPSVIVCDIEKFANAAHAHGVPLIIDNTFPTPINCRPFEFGADIVVHSTSKYLDGHAVALGGCIVDSGTFDWAANGYKCLSEPDETYHGVRYTETFGNLAYIVKARTHLMRDLGPMMSPNTAFLLNLGLETLFLRMERHTSNALAVAKKIKEHKNVLSVNFPELPGDKSYELAKKYLPNGSCGVVAFEVKGGREGAAKFMESVMLCKQVCHVADARTCILNPASTTHRQLTDAELAAAGATPGTMRLSVGIEYIGDILADIEQALDCI